MRTEMRSILRMYGLLLTIASATACTTATCPPVEGDSAVEMDAGQDAGHDDAGHDAGLCVPESDATFCERIGKTCESQSALDNCGAARVADCGTCTPGQGCVVGVCQTPVCASLTYSFEVVSGFSRASYQDQLGSVTPDGRTLLYYQSAPSACGQFALVLADETAPGTGTFTKVDVTSVLSGLYVSLDLNGHALSADGLTLVARTTNNKAFVETSRSARGLGDFGPNSAANFAAINAIVAGNGGILVAPVLSADGLEFFYKVSGVNAATNGLYSSVRASTSVAFPAGTRLPAALQAPEYEYVVGVSSDRLALFVFTAFNSSVFTRTSTSGAFINPNAPGAAPVLVDGTGNSWHHKPLADCSRIFAAGATIGGCYNEDVVVLTRQ